MSDARRRVLERAAARGDREAAGRLVVERLRGGATASLEALAAFGHPGARLALGRTPARDVVAWARDVHAAFQPHPQLSLRLPLVGLAAVARRIPDESAGRAHVERGRAALEACLATSPFDPAPLPSLRRRLCDVTRRLAALPLAQRRRWHAARAFLFLAEYAVIERVFHTAEAAGSTRAIGLRIKRMAQWFEPSTPPLRMEVFLEVTLREALQAGVPLDVAASLFAEAIDLPAQLALHRPVVRERVVGL